MMERPGQKPQDMANEAFGRLMSKMRGGGPPHGTMQEGIENINPENMQTVMDALQKLLFSPYTGPMIAAAFAAVGVQGVREMFGKRGGDQ
jgi:aspartyl-tRNA synthetase